MAEEKLVVRIFVLYHVTIRYMNVCLYHGKQITDMFLLGLGFHCSTNILCSVGLFSFVENMINLCLS